MADPNWRSPPIPQTGRVPHGAAYASQPLAVRNGGHAVSQAPESEGGHRNRNRHAADGGNFQASGLGRNGGGHKPLGRGMAPLSQGPPTAPSGFAMRPGVSGSGSGLSNGNGVPALSGPVSRGQSPFSTAGTGGGPPRMASPPLSYNSGPPSRTSGPPSAGSGVGLVGGKSAPPRPVSGPPSMFRSASPVATPGASSTASPVSSPAISARQSWSANGHGIRSSSGQNGGPNHFSPPSFPQTQGPPSTGALGSQSGPAQYGPPSFPPPHGAAPRSSNGRAPNGGQAYGEVSALSSPMPMYGEHRLAPQSAAMAPGQYPAGYVNGGMGAPTAAPRAKINPEQIPRPDVEKEGTTYRTCTPPSVRLPPRPTARYVAIDEGNCSPRFMRSTMSQLPVTADAASACKIPMAVVVQPMALVEPGEVPVTVVDFGDGGPLRCESCRAYINSFAKFTQNGEKWMCNFCKREGPVPQNYQCPLDAAGLRRDREQRAELCCGSVDFAVPKAIYSLRPEQQPIFVFCVDVSPRALETGFSAACLSAVVAVLDAVPGGDRARVGLMTFDRCLHVYKFDDEGGVSQMVVAADVEEPYAPLPPAQWILPLGTCRPHLAGVSEAIPDLVAGGRQTSPASACAAGAALRAAADCLEGIGGRLFLMAQSPADIGAGSVHGAREEASEYGGDKEFRMYQPAPESGKDVAAVGTGVFYKALAKDCAARQVCVDLMLWSSESVREFHDAGSLGLVSKVTGGRLTYIRGSAAGSVETEEHLREQLACSLRDHEYSASEAILKVRCSAGIACTQRLGAGVENMPGEIEVANLSPHSSVVCRLEHDGHKLEEGGLIFVQSALLYTSTSGQRRVRCHTLGLPATGLLADIFRSADVETISAVMARQAVSRALHNKVAAPAVLKNVEESMLSILFSYRKRCAPDSLAGQLILPDTLRVLPLYSLCTHKIVALRPNFKGSTPDVRADERAARLLAAHNLSIADMVRILYPSLYSVHDLPPDIGDVPPPPDAESYLAGEGNGLGGEGGKPRPGVDVPFALPPTSEKLISGGVYLLDTGEELLLYVGRAVDGELMQELFGVDATAGAGPGGMGNLRLREDDGYEQARRVRNVIAHLRRGCPVFKPLVVVAANSGVPAEARFASLMMEDKTKHGTSYVDELYHLHHKIQSRMG